MDLKQFIKQDQVTYNIIDQIFVVYREYQKKPNMESKMHEYGFPWYNPTDKSVVLINDVSLNNQLISKRQIKNSEQAKTLYSKLGYSSVKYFRWIVQIQKIVDCPVVVQDIDIAHKIWVKNIEALKVRPNGRNQSIWQGTLL